MVLWFRNDLRIHDNPALMLALENNVTKAVYLATPLQWKQHHMSGIQLDFRIRHIEKLQTQLASLGILLEVHVMPSYTSQIEYWQDVLGKLEHLKNQKLTIYANQELELNEVKRDISIANLDHVNLNLSEADVIVSKGKLLNKSGGMYKVFTPFKKAWLNYVADFGFDYITKNEELSANKKIVPLTSEHTEAIFSLNQKRLSSIKDNYPATSSKCWPLIDVIESQVFPEFLTEKIAAYARDRDIPGVKGTSGLSPYFAIGALSPRYVLRILLSKYPDILLQHPEDEFVFLNELIWREFYRHILFHFPELIKHKCFNRKYDGLSWENNLEKFEAWKSGETGYPIVDAAMLQLKKTGWMHNRLRMIVASFLTKDLLIDWRWGEQYFMEQLIDGDFASNNGGWQWSAGTGCDAQPYFRVFNPISQSEKFDPKGVFIRKYLPELLNIPSKDVHFPHKYLEKSLINSTFWGKDVSYCSSIVDHKAARLAALDFYKKIN